MVPSVIVLPSEKLLGSVMELTDGLGVDVCITACSDPYAQEMSLELMAVNGRIIFFGGLAADSKVLLDRNIIHYKQIEVTGTTRASLSQFRKTLDLIATRILKIDDLVTSSKNIAEFDKALKMAYSAEGLKYLLTFQEGKHEG